MDLRTWTEADIKRWCWLRAIEWDAFPAYISQLLAPLLIIFLPWYWVLIGVVILGALWCLVRDRFVSVAVSNFACVVVVWGKWPVAIGSSIYLFSIHQPFTAVIVLVWPLAVGFLGSFPGNVGLHELAFARELGFVPLAEEKDREATARVEHGQAERDNETQPDSSWPPAWQPPPLSYTADDSQTTKPIENGGSELKEKALDKKVVVVFWICLGIALVGIPISGLDYQSAAMQAAIILITCIAVLSAVLLGLCLGFFIVRAWCRRLWQRLSQSRVKPLDVQGETERKEQVMSMKPVVIGASIAFVGVVFWLFANRYVMTNAGQGMVYRTNRLTGETTVIRGYREDHVMSQAEAAQADEKAEKERQVAATEKARAEEQKQASLAASAKQLRENVNLNERWYNKKQKYYPVPRDEEAEFLGAANRAGLVMRRYVLFLDKKSGNVITVPEKEGEAFKLEHAVSEPVEKCYGFIVSSGEYFPVQESDLTAFYAEVATNSLTCKPVGVYKSF